MFCRLIAIKSTDFSGESESGYFIRFVLCSSSGTLLEVLCPVVGRSRLCGTLMCNHGVSVRRHRGLFPPSSGHAGQIHHVWHHLYPLCVIRQGLVRWGIAYTRGHHSTRVPLQVKKNQQPHSANNTFQHSRGDPSTTQEIQNKATLPLSLSPSPPSPQLPKQPTYLDPRTDASPPPTNPGEDGKKKQGKKPTHLRSKLVLFTFKSTPTFGGGAGVWSESDQAVTFCPACLGWCRGNGTELWQPTLLLVTVCPPWPDSQTLSPCCDPCTGKQTLAYMARAILAGCLLQNGLPYPLTRWTIGVNMYEYIWTCWSSEHQISGCKEVKMAGEISNTGGKLGNNPHKTEAWGNENPRAAWVEMA